MHFPPQEWTIHSHTFLLPADRHLLEAELSARGIKLIDRAREIPESKKYIVQKLRAPLHHGPLCLSLSFCNT